MDQLEKFIQNNRADFDAETPHLRVWKRLENDLERRMPQQERTPVRVKSLPVRSKSIYRTLSVAAIGLLLLVAGGIVGSQFFGNTVTPLESLAEISPEYGEMERYYRKTIDQQYAQLASYNVDPVVRRDLAQLDSTYRELSIEIQRAPEAARPQVVEAMIENYRTKVELLEFILDRMQTIQPEIDEEDGITI